MRQATYTRFFKVENEALDMCSMKNSACRRAKNSRDRFAVVDGPDNNFAVVDLITAFELGVGYRIV